MIEKWREGRRGVDGEGMGRRRGRGHIIWTRGGGKNDRKMEGGKERGRRRGDGEKEREGAHNLDKGGGGGRMIEKWREGRRRGRLERESGRGNIIWTRERMRGGGWVEGLEEGGHTWDNKFGLHGIVYAINVFTAHC